ncbi:hypothetical protein VSR01_02865 [Actinacidiphila sp. DG2A-62]|uniref:hypothetical protein n=1 Tax=Actinacidiphila sp. DG2A-62 TaxID=3108821 RepID=UPI002DB984EA|nr:hypothetical protein [Actinacidiphila sp. DG2A-62]MEC3992544.1 hypothetical protein [Actinacidiphila sp. DG2A-62]
MYAAYNAWAGPEEIREYRFNGHEGGAGFHTAAQLPRPARHVDPGGDFPLDPH